MGQKQQILLETFPKLLHTGEANGQKRVVISSHWLRKDKHLRGSKMTYDPKRVTTEQLMRSYKVHVSDNGTWCMNSECRRLYLIHEIGTELRQRGIDPEKVLS